MKVTLVIVYFGRQPLYWHEEGADGMPIGPSLPIGLELAAQAGSGG